MQLLAVHRGGTLIQALDPADGHGAPRAEARHAVHLEAGSTLRAAYDAPTIVVVSAHRQAVGALPPEVRVTARAADGCVEGIEVEGAVGVQWHPEAADDGGALYRWLVRTALNSARSARRGSRA